MNFLKKHREWIPVLLIVIILAGSLPFKFTGHPMPTHIFDVVGSYLGLAFMREHGALIIGVIELVACCLVIAPQTRALGGLLAAGTMAGAIFFHIFSPLGVTVTYEMNGTVMQDSSLFYTAIIAFMCGGWLAWKHKSTLPFIGSMFQGAP